MPSLSGFRIVVTRAAHQAEDLAAPLRKLGADVLLVPVIGIGPPLDPAPLREAASHCNHYDWIVFTESLVEALGSQGLAAKRIPIPSAAVTREVVPVAFQRLAAMVEVVEAYRNVIPAGAAELAKTVFSEPLPDWVTFASSSVVDNTIQLIGIEPLQHMKIASIGPVTTEALRRRGLPATVEANPHNVEGLVSAICSC